VDTTLLCIRCGVGHCYRCVEFEFNDIKSSYVYEKRLYICSLYYYNLQVIFLNGILLWYYRIKTISKTVSWINYIKSLKYTRKIFVNYKNITKIVVLYLNV